MEENSSQCLNIWTQITTDDENDLAEREVFAKTINQRILRQWQQTHLEKLLCVLQCFFTRTNGGKMEKTSRQTQCPVSKILQRYIKELKLTVLLVLFRAPIKTVFFYACQMTVKSCVLHLFPVPQTGRSHIINILLASFFGPYCKIRILVFFHRFMARALRTWAIIRWKKLGP